MPRVFVHGNPETAAVWRDLLRALEARGERDLVALSPPGFGAPVPEGFEPTRQGYGAWLAREIEALDGPVDLVGHDWGAGHVYELLRTRPELLRSWAADCPGLLHADYTWHDAAQVWQTPDAGEAMLKEMWAAPASDLEASFAALGIPPEVAKDFVAAQDEDMARCILVVYRSAAQPAMAELGRELMARSHPPGLSIIAHGDTYVGPLENAHAVAKALGARMLELPDEGHWWMFSGAEAAADALIDHWRRAD